MNCAHTFWWDSTFLTNRPSEALLLVKYNEPAVMNENIIHALKHIISINVIVIVFLSSLLLFLLLPFLFIIIVIINNCLFNYVLTPCWRMLLLWVCACTHKRKQSPKICVTSVWRKIWTTGSWHNYPITGRFLGETVECGLHDNYSNIRQIHVTMAELNRASLKRFAKILMMVFDQDDDLKGISSN